MISQIDIFFQPVLSPAFKDIYGQATPISLTNNPSTSEKLSDSEDGNPQLQTNRKK